ncbi:hypothetical protein LCGC14_2932730 [marine sediment metagenome]|uniref:Uncharacterized protein n=1 Tax=marine sediment metagenome TaxID=412755 RepID=A0A0F8XKB2_9ZZZZ
MRIGILDANRKTSRPGECWGCKNRIEVKELHAVVILRYGKVQQSLFKLAAAQGRARSKKAGFKYRRLHLKDCLGTWLVAIYTYRSEARSQRKGRPQGSSQLPQMSDEDRLVRKRLVRRKAATLRLILKEEDDQRLAVLVGRMKSLDRQMDIDVIENMARRSESTTRLLNQKIRRVMELPDGHR